MNSSVPETLQTFSISPGRSGRLHSLPALERAGWGAISRLPLSLRVMLESIIRTCDGHKITVDHAQQVAGWQATAPRTSEIPFAVARILVQDFTGIPLLCDLAAMRSAVQRAGGDAQLIEPSVPVHLVIDHSVQLDHVKSASALTRNMHQEFQRNSERYRFIKWGMRAFSQLTVVPPDLGIVHQVNLEHLSPPIWQRDGIYFPDSLIGTDSHTTMINGLGVVGWGVGGIEAEAAMLGQPLYLLMPDVVGVHLHGTLPAGATTTDLVLYVTEALRQIGVVGKFVEFFGRGAAALSVPDRATLANMAPEYGATLGYFAVDEHTLAYFTMTDRRPEDIIALQAYLLAQGMFGTPLPGAIDYTTVIELDLGKAVTCVAGPRRPQERIPLGEVKKRFIDLFSAPVAENGYHKPFADLAKRYSLMAEAELPVPTFDHPPQHTLATPAGEVPTVRRHEVEMVDALQVAQPSASPSSSVPDSTQDLGNGDIIIASITSCTNTSNPGVMLAAGLLAKKAVARGLTVRAQVKTSLAPGSRAVTAYLEATGLLPFLEQLGFWVSAYGCATCIGNSGPLESAIEDVIIRHDLVCAAVLSGNRNFEARIHPSIRANFLMSPPLVVAYAIAGRLGIDLLHEPLGHGHDGNPVYLHEIWPSAAEIEALLPFACDPLVYRSRYADLASANPLWSAIPEASGTAYTWEPSSYIVEPPYFSDFTTDVPAITPVRGARALAVFGDSISTDHISPAGAIDADSPAGQYLRGLGVAVSDFNSYGARRGNHQVMMRGTFANPRIRNLLLASAEGLPMSGGLTVHQPSGERMPIYDAAMRYVAAAVPLLVFAGEGYGTGSSRDWAAKGPSLLGVKAIIARSFERIHRSNLIGMGVLPLQFQDGQRRESIPIVGDETFDLEGLEDGIRAQQEVTLVIRTTAGTVQRIVLLVRLDTPIECEYYRHGGILPYALRQLLAR